MKDIFILNEIWIQDKIYILIRTLLGWNILLVTQYRYWLRTISSTCEISSSHGGEYDVQSCLPPWWWRQYAPLKRRSTIILHSSISQKTTLNIISNTFCRWIKLENMLFISWNLCQICLIEFLRVEGGVTLLKLVWWGAQGMQVW
jgi:hypothetical protein